MYNFTKGSGSVTPAMRRAIIEAQLMEEFHWLPQDVKKIPYKDLQTFFIIRRQQTETIAEKQKFQQQIASSKQRGMSMSSGQVKRPRMRR